MLLFFAGITASIGWLFWVHRPDVVFPVEAESTGHETPTAINDPDLPLTFGERVEITAGFYRGRCGTVTNVDDDGLYTVALERASMSPDVFYMQPRIITGLVAPSMRSIESETLSTE